VGVASTVFGVEKDGVVQCLELEEGVAGTVFVERRGQG
jgi:hypothetical protein